MLTDLNLLLSKENVPSVITIFGEEDFLVYDAYRKLVEKITSLYEIKIQVVDPDSISNSEDLVEILQNFTTQGLFGERKLLVFKGIEQIFGGKAKKQKLQPSEELFQRIILSPPAGNFLIVLSFEQSLNGLTKKYKKDKQVLQDLKFPFDILLHHHSWIEFPKLSSEQIKKWAIKKFDEYGIVVENGVVEYLLSILNPNLWEINTEIEKIKTFLGERKDLSLSDVLEISSGSKVLNVFEITSLLAKKDLASSIEFINKVLESSKQAILLTSIILKFYKNLLILTEEIKKNKDKTVLAKSIGVNPFFFEDYDVGLKKYSKQEIKDAIKEIVNLDLQLKSSSKDEAYLFATTLVKILKSKDLPNFV